MDEMDLMAIALVLLLCWLLEILISPTQGTEAAQAALRHELGHGLGIWGHSDRPTDVMYYSQVRRPPRISHRDMTTLRYVYEQPTRLGWCLLRD